MAFANTPPSQPALLNYLRGELQGYGGGLTQEMYDYWGGDKTLEALKKLDPNAHVEDVDLGGGEGGGVGQGKKFVFDVSKLPKANNGMALNQLALGAKYTPGDNSNEAGLKDPSKVKYDENYGWITAGTNKKKSMGSNWSVWAPMAVMAAATLGAGLGAAPAMAGVQGGTSAVTGGAAGLAAGNIPGMAGAASGAGLNAIKGGINASHSLGSSLSRGNPIDPMSLGMAGAGIGGAFIPGMENLPQYIRYAQMARQGYDMYNLTKGRP